MESIYFVQDKNTSTTKSKVTETNILYTVKRMVKNPELSMAEHIGRKYLSMNFPLPGSYMISASVHDLKMKSRVILPGEEAIASATSLNT